MRKNNFQKQLKFHCSYCQAVYQLVEVHNQTSSNCPKDCQTKWKEILHEHYQEKVLGYIRQQEENEEERSTAAFNKDGEEEN